MYTPINDRTLEFRGLSSDAKPITKGYIKGDSSYVEIDTPISNGSTYLEVNKTTGAAKVYMFCVEEVIVEEETKLKGTWVEMA